MENNAKEIHELRLRAAQLRSNLIDMIPPGKVGHLGGSSSIMDVVAALYFKVMHVFENPKDPAPRYSGVFQGACGAGAVCRVCGTGLCGPRSAQIGQNAGRYAAGPSGYGSHARHRSGYRFAGAGAVGLPGHGLRPSAGSEGHPRVLRRRRRRAGGGPDLGSRDGGGCL